MKVVIFGAVMIGLSTGIAAHQTQTPPPAAAAQAAVDPKSPAGKWVITITAPPAMGGQASSTMMELALDAKKLTGTFTGQANAMQKVAGTFDDPKVMFTVTVDSPQGSAELKFTGELKAGAMAGKLALPGATGVELDWKAERPKQSH